jgi:hypothetical protein
MDEFLQFVKDFVKAEHDAQYAKHGDPDDVFFDKLKELSVFFDGMQHGLSRPLNMEPDKLKVLEAERGDVAYRTIYRISKHTHPEFGEVYQALVSGPMSFQTKKVGHAYWARPDGKSFKIIGQERLMGGWQHAAGKKLTGATLVEKRDVAEPANAAEVGSR